MNKLIERRHFLMRALSHKHITQEQYDKEMPELKKQIAANIRIILDEHAEKLRTEVKVIKRTIPGDGNMKRAVANVLIDILETMFDKSEVKGVLRQGYKLMRG